MFKPDQMPGTGSMADSFEFIKKMWGGSSMPGATVPNLSVEELNKKITDLKAVESWLELNMNMLRGTIQTLEVQSATIATLQSMGSMFGAHAAAASPVTPPTASGFGFPAWPPAPAAGASAKPSAAAPPVPEPAPAAAPEPVADAEASAAPLANPNAWWNLLQDQFKQAVGNALQPQAEAPVAAKAKKPAAPRAAPKKAAPRATKPASAVVKPKVRRT